MVHESLTSLVLNGWNHLSSLGGIDALKSLKVLDVTKCEAQETLPDEIRGLGDLETVTLLRRSSLESLPAGIHGLRSLKLLNLVLCCTLEKLPDEISGLGDLEMLTCLQCRSLESLSAGILGLRSLKVLDLSWCCALETLPDEISGLGRHGDADSSWVPPVEEPASGDPWTQEPDCLGPPHSVLCSGCWMRSAVCST